LHARTHAVFIIVLIHKLTPILKSGNILSVDNYKLMVVIIVQVTVHRDNLRINNQQDASSIQNFILSRNSTCFGPLLCPSSGVISCTRGNWYVSCRLCGRCLGESGWNCSSNLTHRKPFVTIFVCNH
jgi:hypothetical protein